MNQLSFYRPQTKFAKVMFLDLSVILFTGRGVFRQRPRVEVRGSTATAAGGMHPTGMHSSSNIFTQFAEFRDKYIYHYSKRARTCHSTSSPVRDQDATTMLSRNTCERQDL